MTSTGSVPSTGFVSTTATTTAATSSTSGSTSNALNSLGPDVFMKLLLAQMKYQDPSSPMDTSAQMSQMASLTQVEKLDALVTSQASAAQWQQRLAAESMVGRQVTGTPAVDGTTASGVVTGVTFGTDGATLQLADGSTLAASSVASVTATSSTSGTPSGTSSSTSSSSSPSTGTA